MRETTRQLRLIRAAKQQAVASPVTAVAIGSGQGSGSAALAHRLSCSRQAQQAGRHKHKAWPEYHGR